MSEHRKHQSAPKERPSFIWPLILIIVGGLFLLNNLGLLGEKVVANVWDLWPLFLVAIGLDSLFRRNEIAGPVFMLTLGVVLLLNNIGFLDWATWNVLWRFWPLLLIAVGLEIMIGRRSFLISALVVGAMVALLSGIVWQYGMRSTGGVQLTSATIYQEMGDIAAADISLAPAVGTLNVAGMTDPTALIQGDLGGGSTQGVYTDYAIRDRTGYFSLDSRSVRRFTGSHPWEWAIRITDQIPVAVTLSIGAGDLEADLTHLNLTALDVSQGVGDLAVFLGAEQTYPVEINQAIGNLIVEIPDDMAVKLDVSRAISNLDVPADFERTGDFYYSPGYDQAAAQVTIQISQAIGSIRVRYGR